MTLLGNGHLESPYDVNSGETVTEIMELIDAYQIVLFLSPFMKEIKLG